MTADGQPQTPWTARMVGQKTSSNIKHLVRHHWSLNSIHSLPTQQKTIQQPPWNCQSCQSTSMEIVKTCQRGGVDSKGLTWPEWNITGFGLTEGENTGKRSLRSSAPSMRGPFQVHPTPRFHEVSQGCRKTKWIKWEMSEKNIEKEVEGWLRCLRFADLGWRQ